MALIRAVRVDSSAMLRTEVGDWSQRARLMFEQQESCPSELYGSCAWWEFMAGDPERAVATAKKGLDADDDVTGIGPCRSWMFLSLSALGRTEDSEQMLPALQETMSSNADLEVRWQAAVAISQLLIGDLAGPAAQTRAEALTKEIGAHEFFAETTRVRG
jgi:hypothetical protein